MGLGNPPHAGCPRYQLVPLADRRARSTSAVLAAGNWGGEKELKDAAGKRTGALRVCADEEDAYNDA